MLGVHVEGGTGAGSKRPKKDPPSKWMCACHRTHHGWEKRCDTCGDHRP